MTETVTLLYGAVDGSRLTDKDAQVVGPELERIGGNAEEIVREAEDPSSPLHPYFDWDDEEAARRWRENQARHLVSNIEIRMVEPDGSVSNRIRAFHAVEDRRNPDAAKERKALKRYVPIEVVKREPDLEKEVVRQARREFLAFYGKYERYRDLFAEESPPLFGVMQAIKKLKEEELPSI